METTFLTVNGLRIRTAVAGAEGAPPLVLLHGHPTSCDLWRDCLPTLARRRRVFAPDLPGMGASDKPLDVSYDMPFYVRFLEGFADALGLARFALAAHDLGGMAALGFAARKRERLTHLVVLDTGPYREWSLACSVLVAAMRSRVLGPLWLHRPMFRLLLRGGVHHRGAPPDEVIERYRSHWISSPAARRAFSATVAQPPARWALPLEELRGISTPTLVLWAARDPIFGPAVGERLRRDIPGARLSILPDCGHFLQEDDPEAVAREIDAFVNAAGEGPGECVPPAEASPL